MRKNLRTLGIIGIGAFGEFMLRHVAPFFDVTIYDNARDLSEIDQNYNVRVGTFESTCACEVLVLAVPVRHLEDTVKRVSAHTHQGQILIEVCSVKCNPVQIMLDHLPENVDIIGLHPLFGPQSGKHGIHGLNIAVCDVRSNHTDCVQAFLVERLGLNAYRVTPEQHDEEMAYVQGLTHMIGKVFTSMNVPQTNLSTKSYSHLIDMIDLIKFDSDELFRTIQRDNPFVDKTKEGFFQAVKDLEKKVGR